MLPDAQPEHIHRITSRFGASAAGKTTPPSIAPSSLTLAEIFAGRARCPRRLRSGTSAVTAGRPELSLEPVGTAGTAQHPAAIRKAFCDAALGPPARPEPG